VQVWDLPWSSVQQLRWPGGEHVRLVADVLAAVGPGFRHITIDLKPKEQVVATLGAREHEHSAVCVTLPCYNMIRQCHLTVGDSSASTAP
jgi:hypothetical protein